MNKLTTALLTLALSAPVAHADDVERIIIGAAIIGAASSLFNPHGHQHGHTHGYQHQYAPPQYRYQPHPNYPQPGRVVTFSEPCAYYGQMVMTFDQWNQPIGYRNCL